MAARLSALVCCLVFGLAASATVAETITALRAAPNAVERLAILDKLPPEQTIFDFEQSTVGVTTGKDGMTVSATASNSPMLFGHNLAMTVGFLGPCGMNSPHIHPRALIAAQTRR